MTEMCRYISEAVQPSLGQEPEGAPAAGRGEAAYSA